MLSVVRRQRSEKLARALTPLHIGLLSETYNLSIVVFMCLLAASRLSMCSVGGFTPFNVFAGGLRLSMCLLAASRLFNVVCFPWMLRWMSLLHVDGCIVRIQICT